MAPQRLGQHFLTDPAWRARILERLPVAPDDAWVEIGAGHGEMTAELARRAGRVVAIELDARLLPRLRALAEAHANLEIIAGDVLRVDLPAAAAGPGRAPPAGPRFKVYGNLPYYITSPILRRLFQYAEAIEDLYVVVQLEVAARIAAQPGRREYGYLSVLCRFYARPEILLKIPPGAFRPRPKVASALVRLALPGEREKLAVADEAAFLEFAGACFAQKRKTLRANLRARLGREGAEDVLSAAGTDGRRRAEELMLEEFAALWRASKQVPPRRSRD